MIKRFLPYGLAPVLMLLLALGPVAAGAQPPDYAIQAAQMRLLVAAAKWPEPQKNIDICVIGDSKIIQLTSLFATSPNPAFTMGLLAKKNWKSAVEQCQAVFISQSEEGRLDEITAGLKGLPILTFSNIDDFIGRGGMIGFMLVDGTVKFGINLKAMTESGMTISADVLSQAYKVDR